MRISDWSSDVCSSDLKFLDNDEQDRTEYSLIPTIEFELGGRDTAMLTAEHSRQAVGRDDPEEDDDEEPTQFNRFALGGEYIHRVNRLFFGVEGDARRDDYFTSGDDDRDRSEEHTSELQSLMRIS